MDMTPTPFEALKTAVERLGGQSATARVCGVSQPSVWHWLNITKQMPATNPSGENIVILVEVATGVSRYHLRPDIYPLENPARSNTWNTLADRSQVVTFAKSAVSKGDIPGPVRYGAAR